MKSFFWPDGPTKIIVPLMIAYGLGRGLPAQEVPLPKLVSDSKPLSGIDVSQFSPTVGPEVDFYEYVNEVWLNSTEIPADRADYGTFSLLDDKTQDEVRAIIEGAAQQTAESGSDVQKVGDFYRSYVNLELRNARGASGLRPLLTAIDEVRDLTQLGKTLASLQQQGVGGPFVTFVSPDARKSDQYAVYLFQSGITLPDRDYYIKDEPRYVELRAQLVDYIEKMLNAIEVQPARQAAEQIVELERQLAEAHWTKVANRDPVATYNKRSQAEMDALLNALPWQSYADSLGVGAHPEFIVRQPSFLDEVNKLLQTVPLETWKHYLQFRVIDSYASVLSEELERAHFAFHSTAITGVQEQKPLWKRAVQATGGTLGEVVGKLYVEKHFSSAAKDRMQELVENLKQAFAVRIDRLDWMSPGTKQQAHEKLKLFTTKIGYPDQWKDYSKLEIEADDLLGNMLRSARFEYERNIDKLGKPIDRLEWQMTPQTINAYYSPVMNEIVFPAAILQPPFFNLAADDAVNYGAIGAVIGHEISHGFDDKGSQYDGRGNLRNWWTEEDRTEFERRASQLVQQYAAYQPFPDMAINGELTLGENIGDLGGLSVALEAYRISLGGKPAPVIDGLTGEQRFFLGWAQIWRRKYREPELRRRLVVDPHSPSQYRVIGIVSNMDEFYEAFSVKPDDKMYLAPEARVRIW